MPLWTDLVNLNSNNKVNKGTTNPYVKSFDDSYIVGWYDVSEYRNNNYKNTFEVELFSDSSFEFRYDKIDIRAHDFTIGYTGDISAGEYEQFLFYDDTGKTAYTDGTDFSLYVPVVDCSDPLNDPSCPNYDTALYCSSITFNDFNCSAYTSYIQPVYYEEEEYFFEEEFFIEEEFDCCELFDGIPEEEFFEELPEEPIIILDEQMIIDQWTINDDILIEETFLEEELINLPIETIVTRPSIVRESTSDSSPNSAVSDSLAFTSGLIGGLQSNVLDYASITLQQTVNATLSTSRSVVSSSSGGFSSGGSSSTGMVMFSNPASNPASGDSIMGTVTTSTNTSSVNMTTSSSAPNVSIVENTKIESSLNMNSTNLSAEIQNQMEETQDELSEDYFSTTSQTKVLALMNYKKGFDSYLMSYIPDNNAWYQSKVIYAGNRNQDNNRAVRTLFSTNNSKLKQMIREQYQ
tara:strand:- start:2859 stop:4247 length:1389 start_codon:yes stop_codon:yes gene_type:complete